MLKENAKSYPFFYIELKLLPEQKTETHFPQKDI